MAVDPWTRAQLRDSGLRPKQVDRRLRSGALAAPYRGVLLPADAVDTRSRWAAALVSQRGVGVLALRTAAVALRLRWAPPEWAAPGAAVDVAVPPDSASRHRGGLRLHRRTVPPDDRTVVGGLCCMTATRTLVELARDFSVDARTAVQLIDGALRDGRTTVDALMICLSRMPGQRGVARARALVGRARPGVDSPQETTLRLILEDSGIAVEVGIDVRDADGTVIARADFGRRRELLWGEYDGYSTHSRRDTFRKDRRGDRWLAGRGWKVLRFVDADLRRPLSLAEEWRREIAAAPARINALPDRLSPEVEAAKAQIQAAGSWVA